MTLDKHLSGRKVVYLLRRKLGGYKIGCANDIRLRYNSKSAISDVMLVIVVPDEMNTFSAEAMVHKFFSHKNVDGYETFDLDESDIRVFGSILFVGGDLEVGFADQPLLAVR